MNLRRLLFVAEGQLGDLLLLTPALRAVRTSFPGASISVLIVERHSSAEMPTGIQRLAEPHNSILSTNPNVDELFSISRESLRSLRAFERMRAELAVVQFLRGKKYDAVVSTFPEDRFALWAFLSGASVRVGQKKQGLSWLLTHTPEIEKRDRGVLQYYCDLVRALGATVRSDRTEYNIPAPAHYWADRFLQSNNLETTTRLIALHPGATGDYKVWPPDSYAELIDYLQELQNTRVILCSSPYDVSVAAEIRRLVHTTLIEADTGHDIGRLAALFQRCSLCITNDSGPRHLAVAIGKPTLAFFRQFHDREWQIYPEEKAPILKSGEMCPVCPPHVCLDRTPDGERFGSHCLRMIEVAEAAKKAEEILAFQHSK